MNPEIDQPARPGPGQMALPLQYPQFRIIKTGKDGRVKIVQQWDLVVDIERVRAQVSHRCDARCGLAIYLGEEYFTVKPWPVEDPDPGNRQTPARRRFVSVKRYHGPCLPDLLSPALIAFRRPARPTP
jgi:hypothetical protein